MAFVALVQQDRADAFELLVVLEPAHEKTAGHDLDAGVPAGLAVAPDRVADGVADRFAQQARHPRGGGAGGDPAGFGDDDPAFERERDQRRLAGARRRHQDGCPVFLELLQELRENGLHREIGQVHAVECVRVAAWG
ncbi:hypothetical protein GCM10017774_86930 [Lentzea cavernae]|uniref:Uncharacterized protein n=1 Tax=Lentzea cavernae TaxID=2020703 RepID=A0ABQ3MT14_9PSEU|nr:hypothetical protein GCM10017774_86930 [Lentzea cavernae]